jgi:hypothetical protein
MTNEQFDAIIRNQVILDKKLDKILNELEQIKSDVATSISNQQLLEQYEMNLQKRLGLIEKKIK